MATTISIRQALLGNLLVIIVLLSGAIFSATFLGSSHTVRTLSRSLISQTTDRTTEALARFLDPVVGELRVALAWGREGLLDLENPDRLNRMLVPLIRQHVQVSSLLVADDQGREHMLLYSDGRWVNRQTRPQEWGTQSRWSEWSEGQARPTVGWRDLEYDPRKRPWFEGAMRLAKDKSYFQQPNRELHWTQPYTFFTTKEPGITVSAPFVRTDGTRGVIGFDVLLNAITEFTTALAVSTHGGVMVLTDDGRIVGLPRHPRFQETSARGAALLKRPEALGWPLATDAAAAFTSEAGPKEQVVRFSSGGEAWWGGLRSFALSTERHLWIAVVVPEKDVLGNLPTLRRWILWVSLGVLGLAAIQAGVVARRYSRPIEALVEQSNRMSRGDLSPTPLVSSCLREVRRLAEAHEHMRLGLQSLLKLERDLQLARQIQRSSLPERLPVLPGFDLCGWSEAAEETGGDTYDVIGCRTAANGMVWLTTGEAERTILLLADATGHGIGPALSATQVRAMARMAARAGVPLRDIACHINEQLCADLHGGRFISVWLAELHAGSGLLSSYNAGQGPVLHYQAHTGTWNVMAADAPPLGIIANLDVVISQPVVMDQDDLVLVISDGVHEARDPQGQLFGLQRVMEIAAAYRSQSAEEVLQGLRWALKNFMASASVRDDQTALVLKRTT